MSAGAIAIYPPRKGVSIGDVIRWAFGVATVITTKGKAALASRLMNSPALSSPRFLAMGTGAHGAARTAVAADTALSTEVETRTTGTESTLTTSTTGDTYQVTGTQTATAERAIDEAATFDASSSGNLCLSATLNTDTLANGDSITWTWKLQLT